MAETNSTSIVRVSCQLYRSKSIEAGGRGAVLVVDLVSTQMQ